MFDHPTKLLLGLVTGIAFGFLLQKGRVAKFHVIMGQFLLRDWTVVKIMATAVAVGAVGVWFLVQTGVATLHVKPAQFGGVIARRRPVRRRHRHLRILSRHQRGCLRRGQAGRGGRRDRDARRCGGVRRALPGPPAGHQGDRGLGEGHAATTDAHPAVGVGRRSRRGGRPVPVGARTIVAPGAGRSHEAGAPSRVRSSRRRVWSRPPPPARCATPARASRSGPGYSTTTSDGRCWPSCCRSRSCSRSWPSSISDGLRSAAGKSTSTDGDPRHGTDDERQTERGTNRRPLISAGTMLGIGMGGFVDGIVLHQMLQVHNMLSAKRPQGQHREHGDQHVLGRPVPRVHVDHDGARPVDAVAGRHAAGRAAVGPDVVRLDGLRLGPVQPRRRRHRPPRAPHPPRRRAARACPSGTGCSSASAASGSSCWGGRSSASPDAEYGSGARKPEGSFR